MTTVVADTETTGITGTDEVIELAYIKLHSIEFVKSYNSKEMIQSYVERFKPSVPINPFAEKVHGIQYKDLLNCRPSEEAQLPKDTKYMIAHNAPFDHRMLGKPEVNLICTKQLAQKLDKKLGIGFENHKLETIFNFYFPDQSTEGMGKLHSALGDCVRNIMILGKLLEHIPAITTFDDLYVFQQTLKGKKK